MKKHSRNHSGEKPFACRDCNTGKEHQKIHCDEKPFHFEKEVALSICQETSLCTQGFNPETNHRKIHREENPDCDEQSSRSPTEVKQFACPENDKKFLQRSSLNVHHRIHTGEKPFACPDCGKNFFTRSRMIDHSKNHSGEKPFACLDCDKKFKRIRDLNKHRRNHSGEKPRARTDCNKTFSFQSISNEHRNIQPAPETEVTRSICNNTLLYTQTVDINVHLKISRNEEKQFVCHVCEEPFSQESLLENHVKIHPDAADFLCERNFVNFIEQSQIFQSDPHTMPVHTDEVSIVPSECELTCKASIWNCVLDVKIDAGDVHTNGDKLFDSSESLIGNSSQKSKIFRNSHDVPVPGGSNECQVICSEDCLIDVKDELVDIDVHAGNSSVSEGSLKNEGEAET